MARKQTQQLVLDFSSQLHERLARLRALEVPLAAATDWTPERIQGVIELLQRICICSHDGVTSKARVSALAARVADRRAYSSRTVQRWRDDASAVGLLVCEVTSHKRGGWHPNVWHLQWGAISDLLRGRPPALGMTRVRHDVTPGGDIMSPPREREPKIDLPPPPARLVADAKEPADLVAVEVLKQDQPQTNPPNQQRARALPEAWDAIRQRLADLGLARSLGVARDCQRQKMQPADVGAVLDQFEANRQAFAGAGAIVYRLREGCWPAANVLPTEQARAHQIARQSKREAATANQADRDARHACRQLQVQITKQWREQGIGEDRAELQRLLREQLPAWYYREVCSGPSVAELRKGVGI